MALRTVHLCKFGFKTSDLIVAGSEVDGGTSLAGYSDVVETSGGGYWQWTLSNASFGGRQADRRDVQVFWDMLDGLMLGGSVAAFVFCDRHLQPIGPIQTVPHSDGTPFSDGSEYLSGQASAKVLAVNNGQAGGLNCTSLDIAFVASRQISGKFSYEGANGWGIRAAKPTSVETIDGGLRITFVPPIRGGIAVGDPLDFDNPRCRMRRVSAPTNARDMLAQTTSVSSLVLVEDMRDPEL